MKVNSFAKILILPILFGVAASALSVSVTGKWNGHFAAKLAPPQGDKTLTPEAVKQINDIISQISIVLTVKADGTYLAVTKGPKQPDGTTKGKWKLKGKTLTLTPSEKRPPEVGTISADGKSLTMSLPKGMSDHGVKGHAVFSKG